MEKVAEYLYYNYKFRNQEEVPDMDIPPELCLELLMAADFLDCRCPPFYTPQPLLTLTQAKGMIIASMALDGVTDTNTDIGRAK